MKRVSVVLLVFVGASGFAAWAWDWAEGAVGDEPKQVTIGHETTFLTTPLRADGLVDYLAALNEPLSALKPEDNGAALLAQALGPNAAPKETAEEFFRLLGIGRPPDGGEYLVDDLEFTER